MSPTVCITNALDASLFSTAEGAPPARFVNQERDYVFFNQERGHVRSVVTPGEWRSDFRTRPYVALPNVAQPGAPIVTRATCFLESGRPGAALA